MLGIQGHRGAPWNLNETTDSMATVKINAMHYKKVESRHRQIKRHVRVAHKDARQKVHDWRGYVKIGPKVDTYHDKFIENMIEVECMWSGYSGSIGVRREHIGLALDKITSGNSARCKAGPKAHEF